MPLIHLLRPTEGVQSSDQNLNDALTSLRQVTGVDYRVEEQRQYQRHWLFLRRHWVTVSYYFHAPSRDVNGVVPVNNCQFWELFSSNDADLVAQYIRGVEHGYRLGVTACPPPN